MRRPLRDITAVNPEAIPSRPLEVGLKATHPWRAIVAASVGNALEWFDIVVYAFFAPTIAKLFFPAENGAASLLLALGTFGVTFLVRPIGAIVLGIFADRRGRRAALTISASLMTLGTAMIAFAPTYATVGLFAPAVLVAARMVQGFSAGGEFGSATAFLAEQDPARRGFYASWQFASQGLTTVLAAGFGFVVTSLVAPAGVESWAWRAPFTFGLLIGPIAYFIRRHLDETPEFIASRTETAPPHAPAGSQAQRIIVCLGLVVVATVAAYTMLFMPIFAVRQLGLPASGSLLAALLSGAIQLTAAPAFGALSDRYGRMPVAFSAAVLLFLGAYPLYNWLVSSPSLQTLLLAQGILGFLASAYVGVLPALMAELFPTRTRTTGLSIGYSLSVTLFGGFAPFINVWLTDATGSRLAPSLYLTTAALVSLVALIGASRLRRQQA